MAGGQLVPHTLPDGRTIMVPGYLAPQALALPNVAPPQAPDQRLAFNGQGGPMAQWGNDIPTLPEPTPEEAQAKQAAELRSKLMAGQPQPPASNEHTKKQPTRADEIASIGSKRTPAGGVDPSTLATPRPKPSQGGGADSNGGMDPLVRQVFNEGPRGGGGPRRPGQMEVGTIKEEREPGKELLPEQLWAAGLVERPRELYEIDPDAQQSTWGTEDTGPLKLRPKLTPIEQGARAYAQSGVREYEREQQLAHEQNVAAKEALVQQSNLMDQQLGTIADRRNRIAKLQEVADKRNQEAESIEPRTREQIWEDKGAFAQIMGALSIALGGYTQGLGRNGGHNPGLEMINKFLDSAVEDERFKHERRQKIGINAKSDLDKAMATYGDLDLATIDTKNRKVANVMALTQNMLADRGLDLGAKERGQQLLGQLQAQYLEGIRQQQDMLTGHVIKQEVNYKQGAPTGGGGGLDTLARLERAARAKKAEDVITGAADRPKPNPTEQAELNAEEADMAPLKDMLARYKGVDTIPGVQPKGAPKRALRGAIDWLAGDGAAAGALDSEEERANRMTVERAALAYRHKMTGAGGNIKELAGIDEAFAGARTRADLERAMRIADQAIAERRRLSAGGASNATAPAGTPSTFRPE